MKKTFAAFGIAIILGTILIPAGAVLAADTSQSFLGTVGQGALNGVGYGLAVPTLGTSLFLTDSTTAKNLENGTLQTVWACAPAGVSLGLSELFTNGACVKKILTDLVQIVTAVAETLLFLVEKIFNFVVDQLVVNMGAYVTSPSADGIRVAWQIVRDLANIGIIGGLVAVAIGTILQSGTYSANKFLARLIISALLVNFSYFFAGAIIDSSNYLATQIYTNTICSSAQDCANSTISGKFAALMPTESWSAVLESSNLSDVISGAPPGADGNTQTLFASIGVLIAVLVTIFVFLSAVALLIGRFVSLIFILITSPIGIVASAIPGMEKYGKEWWNILFAQAFFAPIYFLLLSFSFKVLDNAKNAFSTGTNGAALGQILTFIVATTFLLMSLRFAKQMSETGKQYLGDFYKGAEKIAGWMPKAYTTGLKFAGAVATRNTIGYGAERFGHIYEDWAGTHRPDKSKFPWVRAMDRYAQEAIEKTKNKKFFGFSSYGEELEAEKKRGTKLGEVQRKEEQLRILNGELTAKEEARLKALEEKKATGKSPMTDEEKAQLAELERIEREEPDKLGEDQEAELERLRSKSKQGGLTDAEMEEYNKLSHIIEGGGLLKRLETAEEAFESAAAAGVRLNQKERLDQLRQKGKEKGLNDSEKSELAHLESREGQVGFNKVESEEAFKARQLARGTLGVKDGEDPTAYFERMSAAKLANGGKGQSWRKAQAEAEEVEAVLPEGFWADEYSRYFKSNPAHLVRYAPLFNSKDFVGIMNSKEYRRDIKDAMREKRHGRYIRMIKGIEEKVKKGELLRGTKEYNDQLSVPYYYNIKKLNDNDEFHDLITSRVGEDMRKNMKNTLWSGGSLSSHYMKSNPQFGPTERRDNASEKRGYLASQRALTGASLLEAQDEAYDENGLPVNSYSMPDVGGSDRYHSLEEMENWADKEIKDTNLVIGANKASDETIAEAKDRRRYAQMVQEGAAAAKRGEAYGPFAKFNNDNKKRDANGQTERDREVVATRKEVEHLIAAEKEAKEHGTPEQLKAAQAATRAKIDKDDKLFVAYNEHQAKKGLEGWVEGKNEDEMAAIVSMERTYHPGTVIGKNAQTLGHIMHKRTYDDRFKNAIKKSFFVENKLEDIAEVAKNHNLLQAIEGWPTREQIEEINVLRKRNGEAPLPYTIEEFRGQQPKKGNGDGNNNGGGGSGGQPQPILPPDVGPANPGREVGEPPVDASPIPSESAIPVGAEPINTAREVGEPPVDASPVPPSGPTAPAEPIRQAAPGDGERNVGYGGPNTDELDALMREANNFTNQGFSQAVQRLGPVIERISPSDIASNPEFVSNPGVVANLTAPQLQSAFASTAGNPAARSRLIENLQFTRNDSAKQWLQSEGSTFLSAAEKAQLNNRGFSIK